MFPSADQDLINLMSRLLTYDPETRLSAYDSLSHVYSILKIAIYQSIFKV